MPGGFGYFGAGSQPAGPPTIVPGVTPTTLVASWQIDASTQRYVFDGSGNPLGMDGTEQRVYELVCGADTKIPIITPQSLTQQAQAFRKALQVLVDDGSISNLQVVASDNGLAASLKTITYTNSGTNLNVILRVR